MTTEPTHDQVLALAAAAGDDEALAMLVRAYHDRVYRFGMRVCRDGFDADDALQEAFTKLARRPDVLVHQGALSWLMTVVKNACLRELVQSNHTAIALLERPYREVLVLRDLEGLSGEETCKALGLDTAAMKSRLHRARTQLRAHLLKWQTTSHKEVQ